MFNAKFKSFPQPAEPLPTPPRYSCSLSFVSGVHLPHRASSIAASPGGVTYDAVLAGIVRISATSLMYEIEPARVAGCHGNCHCVGHARARTPCVQVSWHACAHAFAASCSSCFQPRFNDTLALSTSRSDPWCPFPSDVEAWTNLSVRSFSFFLFFSFFKSLLAPGSFCLVYAKEGFPSEGHRFLVRPSFGDLTYLRRYGLGSHWFWHRR